MKLRYYLRGLGIGMLVAALVLILSGNTGGKMSDEAVKHRAAELGMVEKDKTLLGDVGNGISGEQLGDVEQKAGVEDAAVSEKENDAAAKETDGVSEEDTGAAAKETDGAASEEDKETAGKETDGASEEDRETAAEDKSPKTEVSKEETEAGNEEQTLADQIEQRADEVADRAKEVAENSVPKNIVTFEVHRGDTSISVARRAKEMGLVESAADFDVFLCQNGYDKRISIGSYEITVGATQKEIADIVTKSR